MLQGELFDLDFSLLQEDRVLGTIRKEVFALTDTYEVTIHDESQQDLIVAIMIAVDCIKDDERRN